MLQDNQMDIHVRFWDSEKSQPETRFLTPMFLKKATAENLQQELLHGIMNNDPEKMSMLSMDGPNVNWLVLKLVNEPKTEWTEKTHTNRFVLLFLILEQTWNSFHKLGNKLAKIYMIKIFIRAKAYRNQSIFSGLIQKSFCLNKYFYLIYFV